MMSYNDSTSKPVLSQKQIKKKLQKKKKKQKLRQEKEKQEQILKQQQENIVDGKAANQVKIADKSNWNKIEWDHEFLDLKPSDIKQMIQDKQSLQLFLQEQDLNQDDTPFLRMMYFLEQLVDAVASIKPQNIKITDNIQKMLDEFKPIHLLIDEYQPINEKISSHGDKAFQTFYVKFQELSKIIIESIFRKRLPKGIYYNKTTNGVAIEINEYFSKAFGEPKMISYGPLQELNFFAFVYCMTVLEMIYVEREEELVSTVLHLFNEYYNIINKIIKTYDPMPTGKTQVWGIDDFYLLSYIFGSAQMQ